MSEPKFTPGPWRVVPPNEKYALHSVVGVSRHGGGFIGFFAPADAHLIAAAPTMYEALLNASQALLRPRTEGEAIALAAINAALAKARGEQ